MGRVAHERRGGTGVLRFAPIGGYFWGAVTSLGAPGVALGITVYISSSSRTGGIGIAAVDGASRRGAGIAIGGNIGLGAGVAIPRAPIKRRSHSLSSWQLSANNGSACNVWAIATAVTSTSSICANIHSAAPLPPGCASMIYRRRKVVSPHGTTAEVFNMLNTGNVNTTLQPIRKAASSTHCGTSSHHPGALQRLSSGVANI